MRPPRAWLHAFERLRPRRLGLRKRITLAYTLGAFVLATVLSTTTFAFTRSILIRQREETATRQAFLNSRIVQDGLRSNPVGAGEVLKAISPPSGTNLVIHTRDRWEQLSPESGRDDIPSELISRVDVGQTAAQIITNRKGTRYLITGIPIPLDNQSSYYEITKLDELASTLRGVGVSLLGAALITDRKSVV